MSWAVPLTVRRIMIGGYRLHTNVQARAVPLPVIPGRELLRANPESRNGARCRIPGSREDARPGMTNHEATCAFYRQRRFSNATALDSFRVCAQDRSYTNKRRRL